MSTAQNSPFTAPTSPRRGFYSDFIVQGGYNTYDSHRAALEGDARSQARMAASSWRSSGRDGISRRGDSPLAPWLLSSISWIWLRSSFNEQGSLSAPLEGSEPASGVDHDHPWREGHLRLDDRPEASAARTATALEARIQRQHADDGFRFCQRSGLGFCGARPGDWARQHAHWHGIDHPMERPLFDQPLLRRRSLPYQLSDQHHHRRLPPRFLNNLFQTKHRTLDHSAATAAAPKKKKRKISVAHRAKLAAVAAEARWARLKRGN